MYRWDLAKQFIEAYIAATDKPEPFEEDGVLRWFLTVAVLRRLLLNYHIPERMAFAAKNCGLGCQTIFDFGGGIPPWGRSAAEYEAFFALSDVAPSARILDCGGGPSSFAAEWSRNGRYVVAADPMYRFPAKNFLADFDLTAAQMLAGMQKARDRFKWDYYGSPEGVVQRRRDRSHRLHCRFSGGDSEWSLRICLPTEIAFSVAILRSCTFVLIYYFSTLPNSTQKPTSPSCGNCFA